MGIVPQEGKVFASPAIKCWRIVIDGSTVTHRWEGVGVTRSLKPIFVSDPTAGKDAIASDEGVKQCDDYIAEHGLAYQQKSPRH